MEIPKTTTENPYIEFRFNKKGEIQLSNTSDWWGGKNHGFVSSDGYEGNTCLPKYLSGYIKAFKARKIKMMKIEIKTLQAKLELIKNATV